MRARNPAPSCERQRRAGGSNAGGGEAQAPAEGCPAVARRGVAPRGPRPLPLARRAPRPARGGQKVEGQGRAGCPRPACFRELRAGQIYAQPFSTCECPIAKRRSGVQLVWDAIGENSWLAGLSMPVKTLNDRIMSSAMCDARAFSAVCQHPPPQPPPPLGMQRGACSMDEQAQPSLPFRPLLIPHTKQMTCTLTASCITTRAA